MRLTIPLTAITVSKPQPQLQLSGCVNAKRVLKAALDVAAAIAVAVAVAVAVGQSQTS